MDRSAIAGVNGRRVWDSRGRPTVEAEVALAGGARGRAIAPAGASRGTHEAVDLRDGGARLGGFGVARAVAAVNGPIARAIAGMDAREQAAIDAALIARDGTRGQVAARRQRHRRHVARGAARSRGGGGGPALSASRRRGAGPAAAAADPDLRRRGARRPARRHPGLHGDAARRWRLRRRARDDGRGLSRGGGADARRGQARGRRRRRRLVAGIRNERGGARLAGARDRASRVHAGRRGGDRARRRRLGVGQRRPLSARAGGARARQRRAYRAPPRLDRPLPDRVDRGSAGRGRCRRARPVHRVPSGTASRWSATTSS